MIFFFGRLSCVFRNICKHFFCSWIDDLHAFCFVFLTASKNFSFIFFEKGLVSFECILSGCHCTQSRNGLFVLSENSMASGMPSGDRAVMIKFFPGLSIA